MGCSCVKASQTAATGAQPEAPEVDAEAKESCDGAVTGERADAAPQAAPQVVVDASPQDTSVVDASDPPCGGGVQVSAWAWGSGSAFGEPQPIPTPVQLPVKGRSLRGLGTAWEQTLLVASSGALWAAGVNVDRCLFEELPEGPQRAARVDLLELEGRQVDAAAGGKEHIIIILEDGEKVLSWGRSNEFGQLGHGAPAQVRIGPRAVALPPPRTQVRQVACGEAHSLILTVAGSLFAFGDGSQGALGLGTMASMAQPAQVDAGALRALPVRAIAAGAQHSLALSASSEVLAWGCGKDGRLGLGQESCDIVASPQRVPEMAEPATSIAAGGQHSAAILRTGVCLLTGSNQHGQLGKHPSQFEGTSVFVALAGQWQAVALGTSHSLFLGHDGKVFSCGRSDKGQLGTGSVGDVSSALKQVILPPGLLVVALATGPEHGLVLASPHRPGAKHSSLCPDASGEGNAFREGAQAPAQQMMMSQDPRDCSPSQDAEVERCSDLLESSISPGVCKSARFGGMDVAALRALVQAAAVASQGSTGAEEELHRSLSSVLANPTLMNASFCFPGLYRPRIDADGLARAFDELWGLSSVSGKQQSQLRNAAMQGLERWAGAPQSWKDAPPCLVHKDQIRGLTVLLLSPLVSEPEDCSEAFVLMTRLVSLIAALPQEGRMAFVSIIVEDMVHVLRSVLVLRVRSFCNAAVRRSVQAKNLNNSVWEGLLVLDILAFASGSIQQRLSAELPFGSSGPAGAELRLGSRLPQGASDPTAAANAPGGLEENGSTPKGAGFWMPEAPVPSQDLELEVLAEGIVPPDVEFALFLQNAQAKVPTTEELMQLRPHDERLHSFMVHRRLLPAAFLRRVLHVENHYRQNLQQQQGFQDMLRAAVAGEIRIGPNGALMNVDVTNFYFPINVRRDHLLEDTLEVLQDAAPADLQKQLKVTFRGEEGQDAGGVSREFFRLLGEQLFALQSMLFNSAVAEEARVLWFDRASPRDPLDFWMLGVVLGLAVYNSLPGLDARFPVCIFRKLRGEPLGLEDLGEVYPAVASSLRALLAWKPEEDLPREEIGDLFTNTFCLDFSVSYEEQGKSCNEDLKPDGKALQVTLENRVEFVRLYCDWALTRSIVRQFEPFQKGFGRVCTSPILQAVTGDELARIVMGESDVELDRLRPNAKYEGFTTESPCIVWLWEVLQGFDAVHRRLFLSFVTGSDRSPVGGLGELQLKIQRATTDANRLPSAHTCFNTLLLPEYTSQQQLQHALVAAIENTEGFGLE